MALKRITDYAAASTPLSGTEVVELDVAGVPKKTTTQDIANLGGGGGGGGGDFVKIAKVVTSSSQSTIAFASIPNTYTDLMLVISGRDTSSGVSTAPVYLQINGDTTAGHYSSSVYMEAYSGTTSSNVQASTSNGSTIGYIPGTVSSAKAVGCVKVIISNYAGTVFEKIVLGETVEAIGAGTGNTDFAMDMRAFRYDATPAAIASLLLTAGGTAFVDGTTATLYGLG